jgi:hypothetical protein
VVTAENVAAVIADIEAAPYEDARGVEKPCGLIIDFVGILKNLKKALRSTRRIIAA